MKRSIIRNYQIFIIMWNIKFINWFSLTMLPPLTVQSFIQIGIVLLISRFLLQYMLEQCFNVKVSKKQHSSFSLQLSYYYHFSIIILCFADMKWNVFDLYLWSFSYLCIGMLRKAIYIIIVERQLLINDYAYSNQLVKFLVNSMRLSIIALPFSIIYIISMNVLFVGMVHKVINMLCFPSFMLALDSIFLLATSWKIQKNLIFFYNRNISGVSPIQKFGIGYRLLCCIMKGSHFFNLILLSINVILEKCDAFACIWIFSLFGAFYQSSSGIRKSLYEYRSMRKIINRANKIIVKVAKSTDQMCIICMEPLLNSYRLVQCNHLFHYKCLLQWLQAKEQCPICRAAINLDH